MIIDCISDLHGHYPELEGGDLLIVAGDLTANHTEEEGEKFLHWLHKQDYCQRIVVAGNHDTFLEKKPYRYHPLISAFSYLCDSQIMFEGLTIYGSPWTKTFPGMNPKCKAFTCDTEEELAEKWKLIPDDVDILITHSPPFDILDGVLEYDSQVREMIPQPKGSVGLLFNLNRVKPRYHIFGHIHEEGGKMVIYKRPGYGDENNTICVNASIVNEHYESVNKPVRIIL